MRGAPVYPEDAGAEACRIRDMTRILATVLPIWAAAIVGVVLVAVWASPSEYLAWAPMIMAFATIATFGVQLSFPQREGYVQRLALSLGGAFLIIAIATVIFEIIRLQL